MLQLLKVSELLNSQIVARKFAAKTLLFIEKYENSNAYHSGRRNIIKENTSYSFGDRVAGNAVLEDLDSRVRAKEHLKTL